MGEGGTGVGLPVDALAAAAASSRPDHPATARLVMCVGSIIAAVGEEVGWTGYAIDRMLDCRSALGAALSPKKGKPLCWLALDDAAIRHSQKPGGALYLELADDQAQEGQGQDRHHAQHRGEQETEAPEQGPPSKDRAPVKRPWAKAWASVASKAPKPAASHSSHCIHLLYLVVCLYDTITL